MMSINIKVFVACCSTAMDGLTVVWQSKSCHGSPPHEFIKSVRASVLMDGAKCPKKKDGKMIGPTSNPSLVLTELKMCVDSFCVKDVAMWAPHLLLPDHIMSSCPHCKQSSGVDLRKSEFVERPKIIHGVWSCMCLDTCMNCAGVLLAVIGGLLNRITQKFWTCSPSAFARILPWMKSAIYV